MVQNQNKLGTKKIKAYREDGDFLHRGKINYKKINTSPQGTTNDVEWWLGDL
jgi:hypothetical protein